MLTSFLLPLLVCFGPNSMKINFANPAYVDLPASSGARPPMSSSGLADSLPLSAALGSRRPSTSTMS